MRSSLFFHFEIKFLKFQIFNKSFTVKKLFLLCKNSIKMDQLTQNKKLKQTTNQLLRSKTSDLMLPSFAAKNIAETRKEIKYGNERNAIQPVFKKFSHKVSCIII